jgi:hypothetical protein
MTLADGSRPTYSSCQSGTTARQACHQADALACSARARRVACSGPHGAMVAALAGSIFPGMASLNGNPFVSPCRCTCTCTCVCILTVAYAGTETGHNGLFGPGQDMSGLVTVSGSSRRTPTGRLPLISELPDCAGTGRNIAIVVAHSLAGPSACQLTVTAPS